MVALTIQQRARLARLALVAEEDTVRGDSDAQRGESISTVAEKQNLTTPDPQDDYYEPRDSFWARLRGRIGL